MRSAYCYHLTQHPTLSNTPKRTFEWIHKMYDSHTMKYYSAMKRNYLLTHATTWLSFKNILLLRERSQSQKTTYYMIPLIWNTQNWQIHWDRKQIGSGQGLEEEGGWDVPVEYGVSLAGDESALKWIVRMVAQLCKYTVDPWTIWFWTEQVHLEVQGSTVLKITELYTLNGGILWYVNYISIK